MNKEPITTIIVNVITITLLIHLGLRNLLLFKALSEIIIFSIAVVASGFAWYSFQYLRNNFIMFIGAGYFWVGVLDISHALNYEGMKLDEGSGINVSMQFWIIARYLEALILLVAPFYLKIGFSEKREFPLLSGICIFALYLIDSKQFPNAFILGEGPTGFQTYSGILIVFLTLLSLAHLYQKKKLIKIQTFHFLSLSIVLTIGSTLSIMLVNNLSSVLNIVGTILKMLSSLFLLQAIVKTYLQQTFLSNRENASTYDAIPDPTLVIDNEGIISMVNHAACDLIDRGNEDLIGQNHHSLFHNKQTNIEDCVVCRATQNGSPLHKQEIYIQETQRWFLISLSHVIEDNEKKRTIEVFQDITERKQAEEDREEIHVLTRTILENLPHMLFIKEANSRKYLEWNQTTENITGIPRDIVLGKTDFEIMPQEPALYFSTQDDEVLQSEKPMRIEEEPFSTPNQGVRTVSTYKIPGYDKEGKLKYLIGYSEDITEKIKTEEMLRHSQKMDAIGQMSGGIAHDFNNQLGIVLGYLDLLERYHPLEKQIQWLSTAKTAAQRCADLTKQLLDFSRKVESKKEVIDINTLLLDLKELIQRTLTPNIELSYFITKDLWLIEVNKSDFKDAILNLVINARDSMENGDSLRLKTTNHTIKYADSTNIPEGEYVLLTIKDSGSGMSKEVAERIFEPFYTTKEVGKGTGLGLSMVYAFIHRHDGEILLDTAPNQGTTFQIYLPRSLSKPKPATEISVENIFPIGKQTILVVDDEIDLLSYARTVLKAWEYKVITAENTIDALKYLQTTEIDLLFTDLVMPGELSGYNLAIQARKLQPNIAILLTSGLANKKSDKDEYRKHNFELLSKPYRQNDLARKLKKLLDI